MFAVAYLLTALLAASSVSATVVPRHTKPATYYESWLEKYDVYHARYLALNCQAKHNTQFFDDCCHPMMKTETLAKNRKPYCVPSASATLSQPAPGSTADPVREGDDADDDCDDGEPAAAAPKPSGAASDDDEDCDDEADAGAADDDDEDCDDGADVPAAPSSAPAPAKPTQSAAPADDDGEDCEEGEPDCVCEDVEPSSAPAPSHALPTSSVHSAPSAHTAAATKPASSAAAPTKPASSAAAPTKPASSAAAPSKPASSATAPTKPASSAAEPKPAPSSAASSAKPEASSSPDVPITKQVTGTVTGGFGTFYEQDGAAGACGDYHSDNDLIAAIDSRRYGDVNAVSLLCGKRVRVTNTKNGKSVDVTIADACPTCENASSIDLSHGAFEKIATFEEGMVPVTYTFL